MLNINYQRNIVKLFIIFLIMLCSFQSYAVCYVVGDLKGKAVRENDKFEFSPDGFSSQKFILQINGNQSSVTPSDIGCAEVGLNTIMCKSITSGVTSVELWAVYPESNKAVFSKTRTGMGGFDGGMLFVGKILGKCGN
jgi:hypothetical protein